jgi:hypothetical protein
MKHIDDLKETKSLAPLLCSRCGNFQIRDPSLEGVAFERELAGTFVSGANFVSAAQQVLARLARLGSQRPVPEGHRSACAELWSFAVAR